MHWTSLTRRLAVAALAASAALGRGRLPSSSSSSGIEPRRDATRRRAADLSISVVHQDFSAMTDAQVARRARARARSPSILPDTTSSTRYTEFDAPVPEEGAEAAGLHVVGDHHPERAGQRLDVHHRRPGRHHQRRQVLLIDPEDSGTGAQVESLRQVARRQGHRLRPADPRRQPSVLRLLQQRPGRHAHGSGPRQLRRRLEGDQARRSSSCAATRPTTTRPCSPRATTRC